MLAIATALVALASARAARADDGRLLDEDTFAVRSRGTLLVDGELVAALPTALPAGLGVGAAAGVTRDCTCWFSYGARVAWSEASGSDAAWTVTHDDFRLRGTASLRRVIGRGTIALRLDLGPTLVYEDRLRNQGMRAGLTGSALETKTLAALPAGELEAVIALHVTGPWLVIASGGPGLAAVPLATGTSVRGNWIAAIGVGWQP